MEGLDDFTIREQSAEGLRPAGRRAGYFPAYRVEPLSGNSAALGFDAGSEPQRGASLAKALDSGLPVATPPVRLVQEHADQRGLIIFVPQSRADAARDAPTEWRQGVRGLAAGAIRLGDLTEVAGCRFDGPFYPRPSADAGREVISQPLSLEWYHGSHPRAQAIFWRQA